MLNVSALGKRQGLAADSLTIVVTYFLTAATGMLFWVAAARLLPAEQLGMQTALISVVTTVGTVTSYGAASAYKAMLPVSTAQRSRLIDGLVITSALAAVLGIASGAVVSAALGNGRMALFLVIVGSVLMAMFVLKDAAAIGLGLVRWLPGLNLFAAVVKISLLVMLAGWVAMPAVWATVAPAGLVGVAAFAVLLTTRFGGAPRIVEPAGDPSVRRLMAVFVARDGLASSTSFGFVLVLPFLTTWLAGPVPGATLALALAVAAALDFVPDGMAAALTTHLAKDRTDAEARVVRSLRTALMIVLPAAVLLACVSPLVGAVFGPQYNGPQFWALLAALAAGAVFRVPYAMWMALQRARQETRSIVRLNTAVFAVWAPGTVALILAQGSLGAAVGLACGSAVLGAACSWDLRRRLRFRPLRPMAGGPTRVNSRAVATPR